MQKKKRILIYNDNAKRDLLGIRLLEEELKNLDLLTLICNPDTVKAYIYSFKPHAFIAARADHSSPAREISKFCKIFIVPGEGGQQTKETILSVFMGRSYFQLDDVSWITKCYLWGHPTFNWLKETNLFRDDQLKVVGNPRIDIYQNKNYLNSKCKNKPFTLGIAFSSKSTSTYYGKIEYAKEYYAMHFDEVLPIANIDKGRHMEDIAWRDHAILRLMMRYIKKILNEFPNLKIILRPGPLEDFRKFKFLEKESQNRIRILHKQPLPEFIKEINLLLTCWSTTGLEALINGIPVISIAETIDQKHLFEHLSKKASGFETYVPFYHNPQNERELLNMIADSMNDKISPSPKNQENINSLLKDLYNWPYNISASKAIATDILYHIKDADRPSLKKIKETFPTKYFIPIFLKVIVHKCLALYRYWKTGAFRSMYDFRKSYDKNIEKIVAEYFK